MSLITYDLMGNKHDKVQIAIERLRAFEPEDGYYLAFSGGKDSQCIYHLAEMAGVKFDAHYRITSVDPPELVRFIKTQYPDVHLDYPRDKDGKVITMWNLIPRKLMPPTRLVRYCCAELKETGGKGRVTVTGVRWDESVNRKKNQGFVVIHGKKAMKAAEANGADYSEQHKGKGIILNMDNAAERRTVEQCFRTNKTIINPIIDWLDEDVWEYLNDVAKVPHCCLYDQGYKRLGCIGCPMNYNRERELEAYPKHKAAYLRAFGRMMAERERRGKSENSRYFTSPESVMDWYLEKKQPIEEAVLDGQMDISEVECDE
jgi:phosphoadenosine phosphosulfate reductase